MRSFNVNFLEPAIEFIDKLDIKSRQKLLFNIRKSQQFNDPEVLKKLNDEIWEFRAKFLTKQIRVLAFWDKTDKADTLVIATKGFIKKTKKTPKSEIDKAEKLRKQYFDFKKQR